MRAISSSFLPLILRPLDCGGGGGGAGGIRASGWGWAHRRCDGNQEAARRVWRQRPPNSPTFSHAFIWSMVSLPRVPAAVRPYAGQAGRQARGAEELRSRNAPSAGGSIAAA